MKKLFVVMTAAILCMAIVLPAAADVKMSGSVNALVYYYSGTPETDPASNTNPWVPGFATAPAALLPAWGNTNLVNDRDEFQMNVSNLYTSLRGTYVNSKGTYGATIGFVGGQINNWYSGYETSLSTTYMWWQITPMIKFSIGKISQFIGGPSPSSLIEHTEYYRAYDPYGVYPNAVGGTPVAGLTSFGNISTTSEPGAEIDFKINDMVTIKLGIYDPDDDEGVEVALLSTWGGTAPEETKMPRFDIAVPIKWGNFTFMPFGSYLKKTYDQVAATVADDSFTIWVLGASGSVKFGPLTLSGEYTKAQNSAAGNYSGPGSSSWVPRTSYVVNGITQISDVDIQGWWGQIAWQATPKITVHLAYGEAEGESEVDPTSVIDDYYGKRSGWIFNVNYAVAPNFHIRPSYAHLNLGEDCTIDTLSNALGQMVTWSYGEIDMYGISFLMLF
jgi:hypothetical protein